ncbi:hypothetical protein BU17DRAFT_63747 [Hysterangium stoloniferum]|nr:hypothetical protein BU17DRAFT_63747 [Hysterangium stoloniferum]
MSSSLGSNAISIPDNCVGLVLLDDEDSPFYLQIPLDTIESLCLKPRKYLRYLAWSILGVEGCLALESGGDSIGNNGDLDSGGFYYYITDTNSFQAVDLAAIKMRTNVPSETTQSRNEFCNNLLERDVFCAWTGIDPDMATGLHIIPFNRGSEWFRLIVGNRPNYSEDVGDLDDINDIRNGVFANSMIHNVFDSHRIAILKPSNGGVMAQRPFESAQPPRPPVPVPALSGPSRTIHDRKTAINKRDAARAAGRSGAGNATAGPSTAGAATREGKLVDSEGQAMWDEDDVVLFFWGSSQAARECHDRKVQENCQRMEQWREGVAMF